MSTVNNPFPYFPDAGTNGYIYIGSANQDAQTNPITVYRDAALTLPWSQPIRTLNGYPAYQGAQAEIYTAASSWSITVKNANQQVVSRDTLVTGGAGAITFTEAGTGAVSRTVQDKLRDIVSVKDFGAVGDGVADDTAAIQAAIAASTNKILFFPTGAYKHSATLDFSNCSVAGEGADATVFYPSHSGVAVRVGLPVGSSLTDVYNQTYEKFGITVNANTTYALYMMRNIYCSYKHIKILSPTTIGSGYVSFRVSGAMYLNNFENCVSDTTTSGTATNGKSWHIGNGKNEVGNANADTNVNTFITCRGVRLAKGFDIDSANGCVLINCDAEENSTASIHIRGNHNKIISAWVEAGSIVYDQYTSANGSGGFYAASTPKNNLLTLAYPCSITVNYSGDVNTISDSRINNLTIGAGASGVNLSNCIIGGTLTNSGTDCNLEYNANGYQYKVVQVGTFEVYRAAMLNGDTKLTFNGNQFIQSLRFGNFKFSSDNKFEFAGTNPHLTLNKTSDPGSSSANQAYLWVEDNGSGKLRLCVKFPSGVAQVLATQP